MSFYKCLIEGVFEQQQKRKPPSGESEKHPLHFIIEIDDTTHIKILKGLFNYVRRLSIVQCPYIHDIHEKSMHF